MSEIRTNRALQRIQIILSETEREKATQLAHEQGLSISETIRRTVRAYQPNKSSETLSETEQTAIEMLIDAWRERMRTALHSVDEARAAVRELKTERHEHA